MTLFDIGWSFIRITATMLVANLLWTYHPVAGFLTGLVFFICFFPALVGIGEVLAGPERGLPACSNGCCRDDGDYEMGELYIDGLIYKSKCGVEYFYLKDRFMRLDSEGTAHPHMLFAGRKKRWIPDTGLPLMHERKPRNEQK